MLISSYIDGFGKFRTSNNNQATMAAPKGLEADQRPPLLNCCNRLFDLFDSEEKWIPLWPNRVNEGSEVFSFRLGFNFSKKFKKKKYFRRKRVLKNYTETKITLKYGPVKNK